MTSMVVVNEIVSLRSQLGIAHRRIKKLTAERDHARTALQDALDGARRHYEALDAAEAATRKPEPASEPTDTVSISALKVHFSEEEVRELIDRIKSGLADGPSIRVFRWPGGAGGPGGAEGAPDPDFTNIGAAAEEGLAAAAETRELIRLWRDYEAKKRVANDDQDNQHKAIYAGLAHGRFTHAVGNAPKAAIDQLLVAMSPPETAHVG